ncbi:MAG TPA: cytidylate kinase family protein [Polyangia bacterium]|jgi:cytidylate kinase
MAIITISRGTFAGGERLAQLLSARLGYRVVSREALYERARIEYGIVVEEFVALTQGAPNVFDRNRRQSRRLLVALQACLCGLVAEDGVIYHGQSGHLFLPGVTHILRVRLIAPRARRIELARERERLTEAEANHRIDHVDAERERWNLFFYGLRWEDPGLYDVTLNLERLSVDDAAAAVAPMTELAPLRATDVSRRRLRDLQVESRVNARLMLDPIVGSYDVEVEVTGGRVKLDGLASEQHVRWALEQVRRIPGVEHVEAAPPVAGR